MAKTISGASAFVTVGGKRVGYCTGVSAQQITQLARVDVLGQIDTKEIEPLGRMVSLSIGFIRILSSNDAEGLEGRTAEELALVPAETTATSDAESTRKVLAIMEDGWDLDVYDIHNDDAGELIYKIKGCRTSSQSWAVVRGSLLGINITAEALKMIEIGALGRG